MYVLYDIVILYLDLYDDYYIVVFVFFVWGVGVREIGY